MVKRTLTINLNANAPRLARTCKMNQNMIYLALTNSYSFCAPDKLDSRSLLHFIVVTYTNIIEDDFD